MKPLTILTSKHNTTSEELPYHADDKKNVYDDDKNDADDSSSSSVDTNEAFLEFLGLTQDTAHFVATATSSDAIFAESQCPAYSPCSSSTSSSSSSSRTLLSSSGPRSSPSDHDPRNRRRIVLKSTPIELPPKCSRHFIPPSSCLALVLEDVLTVHQCQYLIQKATGSTSSSSGGGSSSSTNAFRYITEATHKAPDGSSFTVQLQNPNRHKLSIIDTFHQHNDCDDCDDYHHDDNYKNKVALDASTTTTPPSAASGGPKEDIATQIMDELYCKIYTTLKNHPSYISFQKRLNCGNMQGLNPRMRILKYDAQDNDRFDAHFDATTFVPNNKNGSTGAGTSSSTCKQRQSLITVLLYLNNGGGIDFEGGETLYLNSDGTVLVARKERLEGKEAVKVVPKVGNVVVFEHDLFHSGAPLVRGTKYIMRTDILFSELASDGGAVGRDEEEEEQEQKKEGHVSSSMLVSDICEKLEFSSDQCSILHDMDLYESTCEAFLAPGITVIKSMLVDGGMIENNVTLLLKEVMRVLKHKQ